MVHSGDKQVFADAVSDAPPLGWRLGMTLCDVLIAASILGFGLLALYEAWLLELF